MKQRTLVILKPECIDHCLVGRVLRYFDEVGYRPVAMKVETSSEWSMRQHYKEVIQKVGDEIGNDIIKRMTRGPCIFAIYEGNNAIEGTRGFVGPTDSAQAPKGTIRGDMGAGVKYNVIHASDGPESAKREINLWFPGISHLCGEADNVKGAGAGASNEPSMEGRYHC
jgi:nucleoside-diphosphate kinase